MVCKMCKKFSFSRFVDPCPGPDGRDRYPSVLNMHLFRAPIIVQQLKPSRKGFRVSTRRRPATNNESPVPSVRGYEGGDEDY